MVDINHQNFNNPQNLQLSDSFSTISATLNNPFVPKPIAYGDFKERKILLLALITLFILNLIESFLLLGVYDLLIITGINLLVVSIIFSTTYFYLKKIKKVKVKLLII